MTKHGRGMAVFESLHAEDEPWLEDCYVFPDEFDRMAADRSVVVFGRPGSGRTALCRILEKQALARQRLPVRWSPNLTAQMSSANAYALSQQIADVFDACGIILLEYVCSSPVPENMPSWVIRLLRWFVHRFVRGDIAVRAGHLLGGQSGQFLETLFVPPEDDLLPPDNYPLILAEMTKALEVLGLGGVWVLVDAPGLGQEQDSLLAGVLGTFLGALPFFQQYSFRFKFLLPSWLDPSLREAEAIARRRADRFELRWDHKELRRIVEVRLALATGNAAIRLEDICDAPGWLRWLERAGGECPREWLDQVSPVARYFLTHNRPANKVVWTKLRQETPPRLFLDPRRGFLVVGGREISVSELSGKAYAALCYLYAHPNQLISRQELYWRGCRGFDLIPRRGDEGYESPAEYRGLLDTLLWRLRRAVEPDPTHPVLLRTIRGHGVRLEVRW